MFLVVLRASLRWSDPRARAAAFALLAAPALYHVASIGILYPHPEGFLVYLILASTVALLVAERARVPLLRGIAWLVVTVPLAEWLDVHRTHVAAAIVTVLAIHAVYLAASLQALRERTWSRTLDTLLASGNGLAVFAELSIVLSGRAPDHLALIAVLLAAANLAVAFAAQRWDRLRALYWVAVAATLVAIAIAIRFEGPWVVAMWAVEGAALTAIAIRSDHRAVRVGGWVLLLVAVLRWAAPDVQRAGALAVPVLNARALSGLLLVGLFYALALFAGPAADRDRGRRIERAAFFVWASALTVAVISREIDAFWAARAAAGAVTDIVRQAMLSAAWALYAAVAIAVGIRRRYRPIRYFAIALFGITLAKVFVVDLGTLAGINRIIAFFVVGVVLLFASFLYQRGRAQHS
jgi:hypothetical protein